MHNRLLKGALGFTISTLIPLWSFGQTPISGAIASDTTWTAGTVIADSVYVPSGRTLTIQPGTTVKFNAGKMLVIAGKIVALGTSGNPIVFTSNLGSPTPGSWNGVELQSTADVNSALQHCVVEYAGGGTNAAGMFYKTGAPNIGLSYVLFRSNAGHGVNTRASSPRISNSTFQQNSGYGVYSDLLSNFIVDSCTVIQNTAGGVRVPINSSPTITNSRIDSNGIGIFIDGSASPTVQRNNIRYNNIGIQFTQVGSTQPTISQDTIRNNVTWGFLNTSTTTTVLARNNYWGSELGPYHPGTNPTGLGDRVSDNVDFQPWVILATPLPVTNITANITTTTTWSSGVFWVKNSVSVTSGDTLIILPGVIVKFAANAQLTVDGTIIANGTSANLIVFTSEKDDSYGGDSNGDAGATLPARGNWDMVWLRGGGNNNSALSHCLFRFGGSTGNGNVRVESSTPTITNLTSTQSSYYGAFFYNGANASVSNSSFGSNSLDGILIQSASPTFYAISAVNNGRYGIYANSGSCRFTVRKSTFTGNSYGIVADAGSPSATLVSMDSSNVSNNINGGLYLWYGTGAQTFAYNRIAHNGAYGLWCYNVDNIVTIEGDTILNNGQEGIVTSKAVIRNNVLQGNRYPIALFGRVGSTYSGNTISGNTFNNALALRIDRFEESFSDTLKATLPAGMTSKTYVMIDNSAGWGIRPGETLVIEPGVIIKMNPGQYWRVEGTLIANATSANPIVFTSYRDASYGGKTNAATDNSAPAPNDWRYIRLRINTVNNSVLSNVLFKYGGMDNVGNLWIENNVDLVTPIRNIVSRRSSSMGIRIGDSKVTFEGCTIDSNASYGIYVEGNRPSDVTARNSFIRYNGNEGLRAVNNSAFREVSNCFVQYNDGWGVGVDNGTIPQVFQGNTITNNGYGGIYNNSTVIATDLNYIGNTVSDHSGEGVLSSRARFIDNAIQRNRYPLAVWRRLGNIYTDNNGNDGNVISGNTYNNAIAVWDGPISDTLSVRFPAAITSRTYVAIYDIQVSNGTTLVIEPGVIMKFQQIPTNNWQTFDLYGTLKAEGTPGNPIIFTSWRDSTAGGKTTAVNDYVPPAPGDWYYLAFRDGSENSRIRHCQFRYGGRDNVQTVYIYRNHGSMVFSNNLVRRSMAAGIVIDNTPITIDSTTVDSSNTHGIRAYDRVSTNITLRHSKLLYNGRTAGAYGLWVEGQAKIAVMTNCEIVGNNGTGVYVENNTVPFSVISNLVSNNNGHGLYLVARNDAIDTLLIVADTKIRNNAITGLFSSRAYVVDDSITGNRYAIGAVGQISLAGTGTANGNVYQNVLISGNTYNDVLVTEETVFGLLGASFPPGYTSKVVAVRGGLFVPNGATLTIAPGTVIKFPREYVGGAAGGDGRFRVDGVLKSEGTSASKIVFTSWKDDSFGGDTNGDANATVPGPADWDMLYLNGASNNATHIFNTIVRYGGRTGNGNIRLDGTTAPIDSSGSSFSSNYGLYLLNSSPALSANEIHNNPTGILTQGSSNPVLRFNNIRDNSTYGFNNNTNITIDAINNYWGAASGPFVNQGTDQNLTGTGNRILLNPGAVTYRPFLTARSGILIGDVSQNGTISAFDAALVLQSVVSLYTLSPSQTIAADVSGDGTVTAFDASLILRYVVGLITGFPAGKLVGNETTAAFEFRTARPVADELHLTLRVDGSIPIYSTEIHLAYDSTQLAPVEVRKTVLSDSMMLFHNFQSLVARVALAGTVPTSNEGDLVTIVFKVKQQAPAFSLTFTRFLLNETNLTSQTGPVVVNVEQRREIPTTFELLQNYPNPFNPSTTLEYHLPVQSRVTLRVYDMLGQQIQTLVASEQPAGVYRVNWDGRNAAGHAVSSGVYFYRIDAVADDRWTYAASKKMILVK